MTKQARIRRLPSGEWWLDTGKTVYRVTSINAHCTGKLEMLHDAHTPVYLTLEKITEYASDEFRTRIHPNIGDWDDQSDVYCLVREVPIHSDGRPVTDEEIDDYAKQLIFDALLGLADDGIFEIRTERRASDE